MALAYYAHSVTQAFWSEHWGGQTPEELWRVAARSPLTTMLLEALPPAGARVLEAGCGLGQYVALLRARGYRAVGADWAVEPLGVCRAWCKDAPVTAMDLAALAFGNATFAAYVSLGVVEHDPHGPDRIIAEARRVLAPGGTLLLSVPYLNLARRLGAPSIRRANERIRAAGGSFYQFAFTRGEGRAAIERHGFRVLRATPYDPARLLRGAARRLGRAARIRRPANAGAATPATARTAAPPAPAAAIDTPPPSPTGLAAIARRLLYTRPALHALGHMILFVAVK